MIHSNFYLYTLLLSQYICTVLSYKILTGTRQAGGTESVGMLLPAAVLPSPLENSTSTAARTERGILIKATRKKDKKYYFQWLSHVWTKNNYLPPAKRSSSRKKKNTVVIWQRIHSLTIKLLQSKYQPAAYWEYIAWIANEAGYDMPLALHAPRLLEITSARFSFFLIGYPSSTYTVLPAMHSISLLLYYCVDITEQALHLPCHDCCTVVLWTLSKNSGGGNNNLIVSGTTNMAEAGAQVWELTSDFIHCSCRFVGSLKVKGEEYKHGWLQE